MVARFPVLVLTLALLASGCITAPQEDAEPPAPATVQRAQQESFQAAVATAVHPQATDLSAWTVTAPAAVTRISATLSWTDENNRFTLRVADPAGDEKQYSDKEQNITLTIDAPSPGDYRFHAVAEGVTLEDTVRLEAVVYWLEVGSTDDASSWISVRQENGKWIAETRYVASGPVDATVDLQADTFNGDAELRHTDSDQATVTLDAWARAESEARARQLLKEMVVSVFVTQSRIEAVAERPQPVPDGESSGARLRIETPSAVDGLIDSSNGDLELTGIRTSGLTATTSNGKIRGDLTTSGDLTLDTSNGKITVDLTPTKSHRLEVDTSNGDIVLRLAESDQIGYRLEADTSNGDVSEDMQGASVDHTDDDRDEGVLQTSGYSSRAIKVGGPVGTSNGDITFRTL